MKKNNFIIIFLFITNLSFITFAMEENLSEKLLQLTGALLNLEEQLRQSSPPRPSRKIRLSIPSYEDIAATRRSFAGQAIELYPTLPIIVENVRPEIAELVDKANSIVHAAAFVEFPIKDETFQRAALLYNQAQNLLTQELFDNEQRAINNIIGAMENILSVAPKRTPVRPSPEPKPKPRPVSVYIPREKQKETQEESEKEKEIESPIEQIKRKAKESAERREREAHKTEESTLGIFEFKKRRVGLKKDFVVKDEIKLVKNLTEGTDPSISFQLNTLATAADKKATAYTINNFINTRVKDPKYSDSAKNNQLQIFKGLATLLAIDPLLIQSSIETLRLINVPIEDLYQLMIELYTGRIDLLKYQFDLMRKSLAKDKSYTLPEGMRSDIDEGLTYPIEISGEVQDAEIKFAKDRDTNAQNFFNTVNDLWRRLLLLLNSLSQGQKNALQAEGINIDQYIKDVEQQKPRIYCKLSEEEEETKEKIATDCILPYKSFYTDLNEISEAIANYDDKATRNKKALAIQTIINKLKAFATYSNDPKFCQTCFVRDALHSDANVTKNQFIKIEEFFKKLQKETQDKKYDAALALVKQLKESEQSRKEDAEKNRADILAGERSEQEQREFFKAFRRRY